MPRPRPVLSRATGSRPSSVVLLAVVLSLFLVLSGCGGGSESEPSDNGESTPAAGEDTESETAEEEPTEEPYLPVPEGVELTAQGSELEVGETAVVAYEPRQDQVAALEITVTALLDADFGDFVGWELTPETRKTNPFFVEATVENVGDTNLAGEGVPLYAVDGNNTLIEASTFGQDTFKPCPQESFPKGFKTGDKDKFCLVYLAPDKGDLTAVSFRPVEEFDPITWTGKLDKTGADKKGKKGGGNKGGGRNGGGRNGGGNRG